MPSAKKKQKPGAAWRQAFGIRGGIGKPTKACASILDAPISQVVLIVDEAGRSLAFAPAIEGALKLARITPGAVAVVGAPSGRLLATVTRGMSIPIKLAALAAARWRQRQAQDPRVVGGAGDGPRPGSSTAPAPFADDAGAIPTSSPRRSRDGRAGWSRRV